MNRAERWANQYQTDLLTQLETEQGMEVSPPLPFDTRPVMYLSEAVLTAREEMFAARIARSIRKAEWQADYRAHCDAKRRERRAV